MPRTEIKAARLAVIALTLVSHIAVANASDGVFRGMMVCERLRTSEFMFRGPLDIIVTGNTVIAARPIFNVKRTLVIGTEIATGTMADDGTIKISSKWRGPAGTRFQGSYSGVLSDTGGTLTGTQAWTWTMPEGSQTPNCTAAVVKLRSP